MRGTTTRNQAVTQNDTARARNYRSIYAYIDRTTIITDEHGSGRY